MSVVTNSMTQSREGKLHGHSAQAPVLRVAQIGVGGYGGTHLRFLRGLKEMGRLELVSVADPFEHRMPELSAELRSEGVVWHRQHHDLLAAGERLDLVVIAVPIHLHERMTLEVLQGAPGARILLEKPAVPSLEQLERLIAADSANRVRVGFQTALQQQVIRLKQWVQSGELGDIESVTVAAGWPRDDDYYQRAPWAGRMYHDNQLVYDGPATNALSHLLNNVCNIMGGALARPDRVEGWLARAREIESYDTFFSECRMGGAKVRALLTHAVAKEFPYAIKVVGKKSTAMLSQKEPLLRRSDHEKAENIDGTVSPYTRFYADILGPEDVFAAMPGTLQDVRSYTAWTEAVRLSGPIRSFDPSRFVKTDDGVVAVSGMEKTLGSFLHEDASFGADFFGPTGGALA